MPGTSTSCRSCQPSFALADPGSAPPRDQLSAALAERGIDCSVHFIPTHHHPYFQRLLGAGIGEAFPGADAAFARILSLPLYQGLAFEEVDRVCAEIADLHRAAAPGAA
jgi:dTDP-4-amino-4,6-dideoxygalactose transaminase